MNRRLLYGVAAAGLAGCAMAIRGKGNDLRGRLVLITGGSRGLGLQLALDLGAEGCRVAICARDSEELNRAVDRLRGEGVEAHGFVCDVADEGQVEQLVERVENSAGAIDILVNNAAIIQVGPLESMELRDFHEAMANIFWGTVHCTLAVLDQMRKRGDGMIVNIASIGGNVGVPHLAPYSAAKFAVTGFSQAVGSELRRDGVQVLTVSPGLMRTGSYLHAQFKGDAPSEYNWFSVAATNPLMSISVRRASRCIVRAMQRGRSQVTIGLQASLLSLANGIAPRMVDMALGAANRAFSRSDNKEEIDGFAARRRLDSPFNRFATKLGEAAAEKLNEAPARSAAAG